MIQRFEVPGLAHYSYVVASQGRAVVIDPKRDVDTYLEYAEKHGLQITHVVETHIHADYASGATALSQATGAELWLSGHDEGEEFAYQFPHHPFRNGEELMVGDLRLVAIHTPGHTPEHLSFLLYDRTRCGQPLALFTGDFIFVGSLGRPDLLGEAVKRRLAEALYESVHDRVKMLPDGLELYPGHGAGSLCGAGIAERPHSTLGYERFCNIFMAGLSKEEFVETILRTVPPFPGYYRRMKQINSEGPKLLETIPGGRGLSVQEFREWMERIHPVIVDLRRLEAFGGAHIPGALNIGWGPNLSLWAGWVVPSDRPILLVGDENTDMEQARRSLIRVGLDDVRGYLKGGMRSWIEAGFEQAHLAQQSVQELAAKLAQKPFILDVRSPAEWKAGHIPGAVHIPAGELRGRASEVPTDVAVHVVCGSGYRSSIASSLLAGLGLKNLINIVGGMAAWTAQQLPVERS